MRACFISFLIIPCAALLAAPAVLARPFIPVTFTPMTRAQNGGGPVAPKPLPGIPKIFLSQSPDDRARMEVDVMDQLRRNPPPLTIPQRAAVQVVYLTKEIAANPDDAGLFNQRCFMRGLTRRDLDMALADCDKALALKPGSVPFLDRRALILYLEGNYRDALNAYNAVLKQEPHYAASLLLRGYTKAKLGDTAGRDGDIAAAEAANSGIVREFTRLGIIPPPG